MERKPQMKKRIKTILFVLMFYAKASNGFEDIFDLNPDKIIENTLGVDIYEAKANPLSISKKAKETEIMNYTYNSNGTERQLEFMNISAAELKRKRLEMQLKVIFKDEHSKLPTFDPDQDELQESTRRFNDLRSKLNITRGRNRETNEKPPKISRRFHPQYDWWFLHIQKERPYRIMETFIYNCRDRLVYMQAMRKKYIHTFRYKIGYLFANLKTIMEQMQWMQNMNERTWNDFATFVTYFYFLQLYESMIKYDIDVTDIVDYMTRLEYDRKMFYDPDYYDERPWEPGYTEP